VSLRKEIRDFYLSHASGAVGGLGCLYLCTHLSLFLCVCVYIYIYIYIYIYMCVCVCVCIGVKCLIMFNLMFSRKYISTGHIIVVWLGITHVL
jgi:hypothetical protein